MLLLLNLHPSRQLSVFSGGKLGVEPALPIDEYLDGFGNLVSRIVASPGDFKLAFDATVFDVGTPDEQSPGAAQNAIADLPADALQFLLSSRYCDVDSALNTFAWEQFGAITSGWERVQAVCDFVHRHLRFDYGQACPTRTAGQAFLEQVGVCRDFTHLAITLCRSLNIPARYATGYLGDIGIAPLPSPMDFSAWFEVFLNDRWYTFDARFNTPRIGRVLMARGRDAADVALSTAFGPHLLTEFKVWADEVHGNVSNRLAA